MNRYLLMLLILTVTTLSFAQKLKVDSSLYKNWVYPGIPKISNNGRFIAYDINIGTHPHVLSIKKIIQSTTTNWQMDFFGVKSEMVFTEDGKYCVFMKRRDSLCIFNLIDKKTTYYTNVSNFSIIGHRETEKLIYNLKDKSKTTIIKNLGNGSKQLLYGGSFNWLDPDGKWAILQKEIGGFQILEYSNLENQSTFNIWTSVKIENVIIDFRHKQLVFKAGDSVIYYNLESKSGKCLLDNNLFFCKRNMKFDSYDSFSEDGQYLFFSLKQQKSSMSADSKKNRVEIWSYLDPTLQSSQTQELESDSTIAAAISISNNHIVNLFDYQREFIYSITDNLILTAHKTGSGNLNDDLWNSKSGSIFQLINRKSGKRRSLGWLLKSYEPKLSPDGKYIIYYNTQLNAYFSYDIESEKTYDMTTSINDSWIVEGSDEGIKRFGMLRGIAAWLPQYDGLLIYSTYDLWKVDPSGLKLPINLTNGYGKLHRIVFNLVRFHNSDVITNVFLDPNRVILSAFNTENKTNGFFSKDLGKARCNPVKMSLDPYLYVTNSNNSIEHSDFNPIRAKNAEMFIVQRMSATDGPNLFSTTDFENFKRLTNLQPAKKYNWYTTELLKWKSLDGRQLQGILYKPENFDQKKKYPVIFYLYQRLSDGLNLYLKPGMSGGAIDIPTFVSNGYLVFTPDIYYKLGDPMQGTYDSVISGANYLSTLTYVNNKKLGIQGHSFGAGQINYLITKSNIFSAACTSSGIADWISAYGTMMNLNDPGSKSVDFEYGQYRMATTLWGNIPGYINNSPLLFADKVMTPLLIKHGQKDGACPFPNALEFFLGLRRLGKRVWMLAYPEADHVLEGFDAEDFSIRMMQFFDHYLKDQAVPIWMTRGISTLKRNVDNGYQYDNEIETPGPGLLTTEEQLKVDSLSNRSRKITVTDQ